MKRDAKPVLIPPDVKRADIRVRTFTVDLAAEHHDCAPAVGVIGVQVRVRRVRFVVTPAALAA